MNPKRFAHHAFSLILTAAFAGSFYLFDQQRADYSRTYTGLQWARQIAAQAQSLVLAARQSEQKDPLGWAVGFLGQGHESRLVRVSRVNSLNLSNPEPYQYSRSKGVFEYAKVLTIEDGSGIRISLNMGYQGFLGTPTKLENDLYLAVMFLFCWATVYYFSRGVFGVRDESKLKKAVLRWVSEAKSILTSLGNHIREMVREAQNLAVAASKSRNAVAELRERIHGGIDELRQAHKALEEAHHTSGLAKVTALSMMKEINRLGLGDERIAELAQELQKQLDRMRQLAQSTRKTAKNLELKLEPMSTDADVAFHSYDDVFRSAQEMSAHIKKTTETLVAEARLMRDMNEDLSEPAASGAHSSEKSSDRGDKKRSPKKSA